MNRHHPRTAQQLKDNELVNHNPRSGEDLLALSLYLLTTCGFCRRATFQIQALPGRYILGYRIEGLGDEIIWPILGIGPVCCEDLVSLSPKQQVERLACLKPMDGSS